MLDRSWGASVERAVAICAIFVMAVQFVAAAPSLAAGASLGVTFVVCVLLFSQLVLIGCMVSAQLKRQQVANASRHIWMAGSAALVGLGAATAAVASGQLASYASHTLPSNAVQAVQLVAIVLVGRPWVAIAIVIATAPFSVALLTGATDRSLLAAIDTWILPSSGSVSIIAALAFLREGASRADAAVLRSRRREKMTRAQRAAEEAADRARRIVHDDVITALRAVELGLPTRSVQRACADAVAAVTSEGRRAEVEIELKRMTSLRLRTAGPGWPSAPPAWVLDAFLGAAGEALRNVERHAQTEQAELTLSMSDGRHELVIADEGIGITDPAQQGFGISQSIVGRMSDVGGSATITRTSPGTKVRLTWPRETEVPLHQAPGSILSNARRSYLVFSVSAAVANGYLSLRFPGNSAALSLLLWVLATALIIGAAFWLPGHTPTRSVVAAFAGVQLVILAAGLIAVAPDGALLNLESWIAGYLAVGLALVAFQSAGRPILVALAAFLVTIAAIAATDPLVGLGGPVGAYGAVLVVVGFGMLLGRTLRSAATAIERARMGQRVREEEVLFRQTNAAARTVHLRHLHDDVLPYLRQVKANPGQPSRSEAALLAAQCRDQLYLNVPIPTTVRARARAARNRGAILNFRCSPGRGALPAAAWPALSAALDLADAGQGITVVPDPDGSGGARIVCVPAMPKLAPTLGTASDSVRTVIRLSPDQPTA